MQVWPEKPEGKPVAGRWLLQRVSSLSKTVCPLGWMWMCLVVILGIAPSLRMQPTRDRGGENPGEEELVH